MEPLVYDTRCSYTGTQIRLTWNRGDTDGLGLWLMRDGKVGEVAPVPRRRTIHQRMRLDVGTDPVDVIAYCQAGLLRGAFRALCQARNSDGSEWSVIFRSLNPQKYPAHCLIVSLEPVKAAASKEAKALPYFFLTVLDVVRVRDAFYRCAETMSGERIVDSVIFRYAASRPGICISGGREVPLTRMAAERLLHAMTEIIAMHVAGKRRIIGVRHGAFGVTNQVVQKFAVASLSVAGWSIPLDWLNTLRVYTHLSILSQKMWNESAEILSFDFDYVGEGGCDEPSDHSDCPKVQVL